MKRILVTSLTALAVIMSLGITALGDTIHLKDGSVIKGQVISFKDQQFIVLMGNSTRGRRSRVTLYMEDVDWIEFDSTPGSSVISGVDDAGSNGNMTGSPSQPARPNPTQPAPAEQEPAQPSITDNGNSGNSVPPVVTQPASGSARFFVINVRVRGDNSSNGWTNSGLVVRRGQRLRISATGRVSLGQARFSTPSGLPTLPDKDKLMRNEATGALIAVVGDDNDDFMFIGANREIVAQRDGVLFLGVNQGNLAGNSGAYDARIEAEAVR